MFEMLSAAGDGEALWFLGTLAIIRVPGETVDGRFAMIEFLFPQGASPPLHTHPQDESFFVVDGHLTVRSDEERFQLSTGDLAVVPLGTPHTFRVDSASARMLVLSTPAGIDRFVREASTPAEALSLPPPNAARPAPDELAQIAARHGQTFVGSPLGPDD